MNHLSPLDYKNNYSIQVSHPKTQKSNNQNPYQTAQIQINSKVNSSKDNHSNNAQIYNNQQINANPLQIVINQSQFNKESKQQVKPNNQQRNKSFFQQYLDTLKKLIFKRKVILLILNALLILVALIFAIYFIVVQNSTKDQATTSIEQFFNSGISFFVLAFIVLIIVLGIASSIILMKGKITMLHCYWITCMILLINFAMIAATIYNFTNMSCESSSNYILQRIRITSISAESLFCSDTCPCNRPQYISSYPPSIKLYNKVQQCPGWIQDIYFDFLKLMQDSLQCSGWCLVNDFSYYIFTDDNSTPVYKTSCFDKIQQKISLDSNYVKVFSIIICLLLILVIFYTNYYIFMQKEDEHRHMKKANKQIKELNKKMEQQLKSSQRMLK